MLQAAPQPTLVPAAQAFEGDMQCYSGVVVEKSPDPKEPWIICEFDGRNQDDEQLLRGRCKLLLPLRDWPLDRHVWDDNAK